jgi:hypothetical protein
MKLPVFTAGPERVWGLTAYILGSVLDQVVVPTLHSCGQLKVIGRTSASEQVERQ